MKSIFLSLLVILCSATNKHYYPQTTITNLQSGIMVAGLQPSNFVINSSHNQFEYIYQLKQFHQSLPQIAICNKVFNSALISFQVIKITGFAFQILLEQSSQTQIKLKLAIPWQISQWSCLKFSIIINSRDDFQAGIFTPKNWKSGDKQITIPFHKIYNDFKSVITRPFLTGIYIETNLTSLSFQLMQISIIPSNLIIGAVSDSPIIGIIVSYIAFLPLSSQFTSYIGIVAQTNIQGTLYQSIQKSVSTLSNYIVGISGFSFKQVLGKFSFTTSLDNRFILTISGNANDIIVSYFVLGNNPNRICSHNIGTIPSYDTCVTSCQDGQITYQYQNNGKGCIQCPLYAHMTNNLVTNNCSCQVGYFNVRGACLSTANNKFESWINLSAQDLQLNFYNNIQKNKNVVPPILKTTPSQINNYQIQSKTISNQIVCIDPNSYLSNGHCYCLPGFYLISQKCQKCPEGSYFNGTICVSTVMENSASKKIYELKNQNTKTIQSTIKNQYKSLLQTNQNKISLPLGALPLGNYSINSKNIQLPPGALPHGNYSTTIIEQNFKGVNPYLYKPTINSQLNIVTVDLSNYKKYEQWQSANINRKYPMSQKCQTNQYLNKYQICICKPGFIKNQKGICIPSNYHDFPCNMQNAHINSEGYCICQIGYAFDKNHHNCIKTDITIQCPIGGVLLYDSICICNAPFFNNQGKCSLCQQGSFYNGYNCQVICPKQYIYDMNVRRCVCQKGFYQTQYGICHICPDNSITINNICTACPAYSISAGNKCICIRGTVIKKGVCQPLCPINSFYHSQIQSCICTQDNYYVDIFNNCVPCQKNTFYDGKTCVYCVAPNWFDRSKKICIACPYPSFYDNGNCYRCPINSQWDSISRRCLCINGSISIGGKCQFSCINGIMLHFKCICYQGFRQQIKQNGLSMCIQQQCKPPSFRNNQGRCIICPLNSIWDVNNQKCNCLNGYTSLSDKCIPFCHNGQLIGNICKCNSGLYYQQNLKDCSRCPHLCTSCINSSFCTSCLVGTPNQYGLCNNNGFNLVRQESTSSSWNNQWNSSWNSSNISYQNNSWNKSVTLNCNVINCKKCLINNINFCEICDYPLIVLNNGQCGSRPVCRTKNDCPFNYFCLVGQCVSQKRSSFTMNLISIVSSSIKQSKFTISITPAVVYFQQYFGSSWVKQSKMFIKISFQGLSSRQIPEGHCTQNNNLINWDCQIFYNNQPIAIAYNIILTAANPNSSNDIAYLLLTVNPVQARFSIEDATILMRTPGSLASMTSLFHTTYNSTFKF